MMLKMFSRLKDAVAYIKENNNTDLMFIDVTMDSLCNTMVTFYNKGGNSVLIDSVYRSYLELSLYRDQVIPRVSKIDSYLQQFDIETSNRVILYLLQEIGIRRAKAEPPILLNEEEQIHVGNLRTKATTRNKERQRRIDERVHSLNHLNSLTTSNSRLLGMANRAGIELVDSRTRSYRRK